MKIFNESETTILKMDCFWVNYDESGAFPLHVKLSYSALDENIEKNCQKLQMIF
jgi:hypothetical protein